MNAPHLYKLGKNCKIFEEIFWKCENIKRKFRRNLFFSNPEKCLMVPGRS